MKATNWPQVTHEKLTAQLLTLAERVFCQQTALWQLRKTFQQRAEVHIVECQWEGTAKRGGDPFGTCGCKVEWGG